jgi:5-methylcytosine-specific restriction endonuclease McrA
MRKATKSGVWKLASEYNRRKDADEYGLVKCCTCPHVWHWSEHDAGHFIPRSNGKAVFWYPENIHAQCRGCNSFQKERAKINYTLYMVKRYGQDKVDELLRKSKEIHRQRQSDLEAWKAFYKDKLDELNG